VRFIGTKLAGAFIIEPESAEDARGFFARTFCAREFGEHGLVAHFVQCSLSLSHRRGTLRGLHFQRRPAGEVKLVRCAVGALWDVIVDLRRDSPTYLQHLGVELTGRNRRALYVPQMFAHGSQSLEDDTEIFYQISEYHTPDLACGLRYNDPKLGIQWPLPVSALSERDAGWPLLG
jgi:dTDP-4-dehydrorhamnose 3,5-epimerase